MRRYEWAKVVGALFLIAIFGGWLFIQWSNPFMRLLAGGLLLLTVWITVKSIVEDVLRGRGRLLAVEAGELVVTHPHNARRVRLSEVKQAQWREETEASFGLWLLDGKGETLAHLDADFLATQNEARTFLNWLRRHADARFEVRWPNDSAL